ncbi:MAG: peptidase [Parvibaculaceae bacterium]
MTYCVGLLLDRGIVFAADTRTNAGVDNIATFKKLHVWSKPGNRVLTLLGAGNLATTQAVVSLLTEEANATRRVRHRTLFTALTMFQAARAVGRALNEVRRVETEGQLAWDETFGASFILGGQIGKERPRLFQIYPAGNFIEATEDTPFFQIGEHKYGKPILDRVAKADMSLGEAAKLLLISFDSTLRSNLSVGMPIDLFVYNRGSLKAERTRRIAIDDPYFRKLSLQWSLALREAFSRIEALDI